MNDFDLRSKLAELSRRVRELHERVKGNEQATKQALIVPFFTLLGYDVTNPQECLAEHKLDFGRGRSTKPIDWVFSVDGKFAFFVEAKESGKKIGFYTEQLADYFAKEPSVKLGILTNGIQWRFFTDSKHTNIMDREAFIKWDVLSEQEPPIELLTILHKSRFSPELVRRLVHTHNLLLAELNRHLEPSNEFIKLVTANIEDRKQTEAVIESWKPLIANAIVEWARRRLLQVDLSGKPVAAPIAAVTAPLLSANRYTETTTINTNDEFIFTCERCGKQFNAYISMVGRTSKCSGCGSQITIYRP